MPPPVQTWVQNILFFQIKLTAAQIKAVEKKKAKPASEKTGDGLAPLDESEEQEVPRYQ